MNFIDFIEFRSRVSAGKREFISVGFGWWEFKDP